VIISKIFDTKTGKIFNKINIIDLLFLLVILTMIIGLSYKIFFFRTKIAVDNKDIIYSIKIRDIKKNSEKYFKLGTELKDQNSGITLGYIKEKNINDFFDYVTKNDGSVKFSQKPDKIELILKIKANAIENKNSYLINGVYEIKNGSNIYFSTKYFETFGVVSDIE
jgi:hypothetical protein